MKQILAESLDRFLVSGGPAYYLAPEELMSAALAAIVSVFEDFFVHFAAKNSFAPVNWAAWMN